ncbi:MAG: rhomboid family intramembrane serine protease [Bacteroidota bacterium]
MNLSITLIIIIMTCVISYQAFSNPMMKAKLLFRPVDASRGEWYRFLSSGLIHADWMHLLVNMYVLFAFGEVVEQVFTMVIFGEVWGRLAFIGFYMSAVVISSIPTFFRHQDNFAYSALGASGATSAIVFAYIVIAPWSKLTFLFLPFLSIPAIILGIGYIWYSNYMDGKGIDNIGHNAHLTGAIYGVVFIILAAWIFQPFYFQVLIQGFLAGPTSG